MESAVRVVNVSESVFQDILSELRNIRETVNKFITLAVVHENNIAKIADDLKDHEARLRSIESVNVDAVTREDLEQRDRADAIKFRWIAGIILSVLTLIVANGIAIWIEIHN